MITSIAGRAVGIGLALISCSLLTSCQLIFDEAGQGPIAIQRDGDQIRIGVCEHFVVNEVLLSEPGNDGRLVDRWDFETWFAADSGTSFTQHDLDPATPSPEPEMRPGTSLVLNLVGLDSTIEGTFEIGGEGLSETLWMHPDGTETAALCPAGEALGLNRGGAAWT